MRQLLLLLMVVVFGVAHATAAPAALCRHASAEAHAAALVSADEQTASDAQHEEASAATAEKLAAMTDKVSANLFSGLLPGGSELPPALELAPRLYAADVPIELHDWAVAPLLHPPSA